MKSSRQLRLGLLLALVLPSVPAAAVAQQAQPTAEAKAAARALAGQGWELFNAGRHEEALTAFRHADAQVHAPPFLVMAARSCERLGRLIEARSFYQRVVDEELAASAPGAFRQAQADAKAELAALRPRIPTLLVAIRGTAKGGVKLTLDGQPIDQALPVERDPGDHTLVAVVPGRNPMTRMIRLKEGTREHVTLDLTPPQAASSAPADGPAAFSGSDGKMAIFIGGGITAGVGVLAGTAFTLVANSKAGDAMQQRNVIAPTFQGSTICSKPPADSVAVQCDKLSSIVDDQYLFSNLALWSFIGGGAAALGTLGYAWLVTSPSEPERQMSVLPVVTPGGGWIVAGGSF
ncbi:tetratricopeptide repeat protein [Sorangium sp. So ce1151]|uniref:tetratricopeptide repeat protein n=1 Tax=Sorangium sp. So ce1151 TaxID=3133332 RepID=UPI003F62C1CA